MQQGSAAWDDVNETAFSDEKLLWHVLKDKSPHSVKSMLEVFQLFSHHAVLEYCFLPGAGAEVFFLYPAN